MYSSHCVKKYLNKIKDAFDKYGIEALTKFDECLTKNHIPYSLATGTLLGAVREQGFLKHDVDIDIFVWIEDYSPNFVCLLNEYGFDLKHSFTIDEDKYGKEETYEYKGVHIDIFYIYKLTESLSYFTDYVTFPGTVSREISIEKFGGLLPRKIIIPAKKELKRTKFENLFLPIMSNADEVLEYRYGKDYMIPNPNWSPGEENPNVVSWDDKLGIYKSY